VVAIVFEIETQELDQWCWAAVSVSLERYLSDQVNTIRQCELAGRVLGSTCCPTRVPCNTAERLQTALRKIGRLDKIEGQLSFVRVKTEIQRGFPIAVRIEWRNGSAHFVIIRGYRDDGAQILNIADPWYENSLQDYDTFCDDYLGLGRWTDSFLLKQRPVGELWH